VSGGPATISTHVLDATAGRPAAGLRVALQARDAGAGGGDWPRGEGEWRVIAGGTTEPDGRLRFPDPAPPGQCRLTFGTGAYFSALGMQSFYPEVTVTFTVTAGHYHVPLLLSPFAYSTYRGS
jgi:5-hydroxyisourate hydrolase